VADGGLDGLTSPKGEALALRQGSALAAVDDLQPRVVPVDPAIAEIHVGGLGRRGDAFEQNGGLFQLLVEGVAIIGIPREGTSTDDEAVFMGDGQAGLDAKLLGSAGLALADAFHFGSVQGVEFSQGRTIRATGALPLDDLAQSGLAE